jgi:hypothetical protein
MGSNASRLISSTPLCDTIVAHVFDADAAALIADQKARALY